MAMISSSEIIRKEVEVVEKMLKDEAWYAGERRNAPVDVNDPVVFDRVCEILKDHGIQIYHEAEESLKTGG